MKRLLISCIAIILIISTIGCSRKEDIAEDTISVEEHNRIINKIEEDYELKFQENTVEPIEMPSLYSEDRLMGEFHYNGERDIYAYIDEIGFEVVGNVNLFDLNTGEITPLTTYDYGGEQQTVKKLAWYSENQLLVIIGFAPGTVTTGGSVYILDIDTKELKLLLETTDTDEIIDIVKPDGGTVGYVFPVVRWDDNAMNFETYNMNYSHEELQVLLSAGESVVAEPKAMRKTTIYPLSEVINKYEVVRLVKENQDDLIMFAYGYDTQESLLIQMDKETYEVKKVISYKTIDSFLTKYKVSNEGILIKTYDDIKLYNDQLNLLETYKLPDQIIDAIEISSESDRFGGYDMSADMSVFVYCDEEGMKIIEDKEKRIVEPLNRELPDGTYGGYPVAPVIVGEAHNIIGTFRGYEGYDMIYYYHRVEDKLDIIEGGGDRKFTTFYNGSKLLNISPFYTAGIGNGFLMNVTDGSTIQMDNDWIDNNGHIVPDEFYYDMDEYTLSINQSHKGNYLNIRDENLKLLRSIKLESKEEYVTFSIVGVTQEGRILLLEDGRNQIITSIVFNKDVFE